MAFFAPGPFVFGQFDWPLTLGADFEVQMLKTFGIGQINPPLVDP